MKTYCFIMHYEGLSAAVKQSRDDVMKMDWLVHS